MPNNMFNLALYTVGRSTQIQRPENIKTRKERYIMENLKIQNMNIAYQGQSAIKNATLAFEPNKLTGSSDQMEPGNQRY